MRRLGVVVATMVMCAGCVTANQAPQSEIFAPAEETVLIPSPERIPSLRFLTINLAHGRGTGFHQALQSGKRARNNLDAVESMIRREDPDVVALQEADAPSAWSGGFDHVDYLAKAASYGWGVHTAHAEGAGLAYGTAIISRLPMNGHDAHTFRPAQASLPKGFSLATVEWPETGMIIDVVSVHLEPLRTAIRQRQAKEIIEYFRERQNPLVLMGDLNTEWGHEDGVLLDILEQLRLSIYVPDGDDTVTYPRLGRRLDWILISSELVFAGFEVLVDKVSDHRAVVADLRQAASPRMMSRDES